MQSHDNHEEDLRRPHVRCAENRVPDRLVSRVLMGRVSGKTYKFRNKNRAERPKPTPTKIQFRTVIGDHEMMATGIHTRFA
jgi:hypothetical protein